MVGPSHVTQNKSWSASCRSLHLEMKTGSLRSRAVEHQSCLLWRMSYGLRSQQSFAWKMKKKVVFSQHFPGKHAGFDSHPAQNGSEAMARSGLNGSSTPDRIRLAKTWHSQPEPSRTRAGFPQYDPGCLWKNATEFESGKLGADRLRSARTGPDNSCTPAFFRTGYIWPKPGQAV